MIVTGSWLTVKEQMPQLYATRLAERGYAAFTFDFTGFGESGGALRQADIPDRNIADLIAAADFSRRSRSSSRTRLRTWRSVPALNTALRRSRGDRASPGSPAWPGGFTTSRASPASTVARAVSRRASSRLVTPRSATKQMAWSRWCPPTGPATSQPPCSSISTTMPTRARCRALVEESDGDAPWTYRFLFDGMSAAGRVNVPALFVHSDGCVFPDNLRAVHERVRGPKRLVWSEGTQTDFYDQPAQVDVSIDAVDTFLEDRL